ncbi:RNA recognition motif domain [Trinorchestia longiramus]|nr:RNA recognition motif domain [Trinorchestia longiramus]
MPPKTKLFVGMLPPNCRELTLRKLFERHGEVVECSIMGSYAFVHMKTEEEAEAAIQALNQHEVNGYNISVEQSTGEKRGGGRGRGRGMFRGGRGMDRGGWGRGGGGGPMRGRGEPYPPRGGDAYDSYRPSPYDRPGYDRRPLPPHPADRYGPMPPPPPMRNGGYYDEYDRAPERRAMPYGRDPYDRYDAYERRPAPPAPTLSARRSPPPPDRRPIPTVSLTYDRRPEPYDVRPRDPYYATPAPQRDLLYPPRVPSPTGRAPSPPRYGAPPPIRRY